MFLLSKSLSPQSPQKMQSRNVLFSACSASSAVKGFWTGVFRGVLLSPDVPPGLFKASDRHRYLTVPAVVMAIEPVRYSGATRWRIRFAYLDTQGVAQETVNEVLTDAWKPGDECCRSLSVPPTRPRERPATPTLRDLHPLRSHPRGFAPRTPRHALSRAAAPARSGRAWLARNARSQRALLVSS